MIHQRLARPVGVVTGVGAAEGHCRRLPGAFQSVVRWETWRFMTGVSHPALFGCARRFQPTPTAIAQSVPGGWVSIQARAERRCSGTGVL